MFLTACEAVDVILLAKRGSLGMVDAGGRLRSLMSAHLAGLLRTRGAEAVKPKHHWAFDIADQLERDTLVLDCFTMERLHLRVKSCAQHVKNLSRFERSVLSGVVNVHRHAACRAGRPHGLVGGVAELPQVPGALVSDSCEVGGFRCSLDDVVFMGPDCGMVRACCAQAGALYVVVDVLAAVEHRSERSIVWAVTTRRQIWRVLDLSEASAWRECSGGRVLVIRL